ncbi:MAG: bifunctional aldolase/short-chain dehydrogenase [Chitinispirillaceae bacterium]|nr:bifunctional aldolase/short-chain dehydrogenase [Chitinispirillaceae bacterium]
MQNRWSAQECADVVAACGKDVPPQLAEQVYATRLLGAEVDLVLHGGGNTSLKHHTTDLLGQKHSTLSIKASGASMMHAQPHDFVPLDTDRLNLLRKHPKLDDDTMAAFFGTAAVRPHACRPSIETLLHLYLPFAFVDHTHPAAILALTNRHDAAPCLREAFGTSVAVIPYARAGFECAAAAAEALRVHPASAGLIIMHHGLVTWGATAKEAYDASIKLVTLAQTYLAGKKIRSVSKAATVPTVEQAQEWYTSIAPIVRGCLSPTTGDSDAPYQKISLHHAVSDALLTLLATKEARELVTSTPVTPDYLIRVRRKPLFIESPACDDPQALRRQIVSARERYKEEYRTYLNQTSPEQMPPVELDELYPKIVLLPGIGAICLGASAKEAAQAADIALQGITIKHTIHETGGTYADLSDEHAFDMEFRSYQRAKISGEKIRPPRDSIVFITGAAGAIGAGLSAALLEAGCHVAVSDLPGPELDKMGEELRRVFGSHCVHATAMDVTDPNSVASGFRSVIAHFGGLDALVVNAGIAHVSPLADMDIKAFRKLERVNVEGTLLTIKQAAAVFEQQNTGGDIVLISTKNVFAPGASFGAYSATKAAAHQLGRIASLELAPLGVRVNMVAPDAVFSHGHYKSGLWATVGPGRMRSRGLDEAGLEEYYRKRNLLKAKVTARHVASAVLFFLSHQTPTTGATIPVDGGLPDSTPR